MKKLLKPTLLKILIAFTLLAGFSYLWRLYVISTVSDIFPWGFPLQFHLAWGPCPPGQACSEGNLAFLMLDILFWYLVSAWIVQQVWERK